MNQSLKESAVEAICNGLSTTANSIALALYIFPALHIATVPNIWRNVGVSVLVGVLDGGRMFLWRRYFVHRHRDDDAILPRV